MALNEVPPPLEMDQLSFDMSPASLALVLGSVIFAAASLQRRGMMRGLVATLSVAFLLCAWVVEAAVASFMRLKWTRRQQTRQLQRAHGFTSSTS